MAGAKGRRGGQAAVSKQPEPERELTDAEMEAELKEHFTKLNALMAEFMAQPPKKSKSLDDMMLDAGFDDPQYIYKDTVKSLKGTYIDDFNDNVERFGDGFELYDGDQVIEVLYRNGTQRYIGVGWWDGSKKIPTANIDSIIVSAGWGTAIAGKNIKLVNYREENEYGRYGYRNVKARYNDWDDIRAEFR